MFRPTALLALMVSACLFPTDESRSVFLTVERGNGVVSRGGELRLRAQAWATASDGSSRALEGATFTWTTSDSSIASIAPGIGGEATATGVRSGSVRITAIPDQFADAPPGEVEIRVANTVEIDRVEPDTVRFGQQLTVYGIGLGTIDRVFLGNAPLIPVSGSFSGDSAGVGSARYWVQAPASSQRLLAAAVEGFSASSPDTVVVIPEDIYETGSATPADISLDGPPIGPRNVLFYNPALTIEGVPTQEDTVPATDIFRFTRSSTARPLTLIFKATVLPLGRFEANIHPDPIEFGREWGIGVQAQVCGFHTFVTGTRTDSVIRVVEPASTDTFRTDVFGDRGSYSIEVRDGAPTEDPAVPDDRFEYNDQCQAAARNAAEDGRRMDLNVGTFDETMTISRPFDIDWYNVVGDDGLVSVRIASLPTGAIDASDLDLYVIGPFSGEVLSPAPVPGSSQEGAQFLGIGLGFTVLVIDQVGVPTRYALCISRGTACAPLAAASMRGPSIRPR